MANPELTKLTNMCMVSDGNGNVLVQNRNDPNWSGLSFPGGHVEPSESFVESVIREVKEETGLTVENPALCGVKQFQTLDGIRYIVFLFKADTFSGQLTGSSEGDVMWIPLKDWKSYRWIPDFADILKIYQDDRINELFYERIDGVLQSKFF